MKRKLISSRVSAHEGGIGKIPPSAARRLKEFLLDETDVTKCICASPATDCKERGKINCFDPILDFMHIRFDPCMCPNVSESRCDCIIFCFDQNKRKQAMFVIEVKSKYNKPTLTEVHDKLQYCIETMQKILKGRMTIVETFPILCDEKHSGFLKRVALTETSKVKCYGSKKSIILNAYAKNIVQYFK